MAQIFASDPSIALLRYGASIAVFKDGAVLLVERARAPWRGLWSLPGGGIEAGELPGEAALRELKEETGIKAEIAGLLDTIEIGAMDDGGKALRYRLSVFYGRHLEGEPRAGSDAAAARWVVVGEVEALTMTEGTAALVRLAAWRLGAARA
jgi:8-oxo-dGTP diphosphatase